MAFQANLKKTLGQDYLPHQNILSIWLPAIRPATLLAGIGPVFLGLAIAFKAEQTINLTIAILTLICTVLMQIGTNLVNDYFDGMRGIDGPLRLGPTRLVASQKLPPDIVRRAFSLCFLLAFIIGLYLMFYGGLPIMIIGPLALLCAYLYTGGPYPLSYMALGEFLAFVFFGPVAVWGTYYLQVKNFDDYTQFALIAGMAPGAISAAIMAINNLRDRETDGKTIKKTLAILLGERLARALVLALAFFPTIVPWMLPSLVAGPLNYSVLLCGLLPFLFIKTWRNIAFGPIGPELNFELKKCGLYLFIYCLGLGISLNFS